MASSCQAKHLPVNAHDTVSTVIDVTVARANSEQVLVGEFFEMNTSNMSVILDHYIAL